MSVRLSILTLLGFWFWQAASLLYAQLPALPRQLGIERLSVAATLKARYTRSPVVDVDFIGTDLRTITAMAVVIQNPVDHRRLEPDDLRDNPQIIWGPVRGSMQVDLGRGDGVRSVWFGFRVAGGQERWIRRRVCVDTAPPSLQITEPVGTLVSDPLLYVKAISADHLAHVRCRVSNSRTEVAMHEGAITKQTPDPVTGGVVQTFIECRGVELALGRNLVTFELTDAAGNTSEVSVTYTLDPSADLMPPEIAVHWPTTDDQVFARTCRIRGQTTERCVRVEARCADGVFLGIAELTGHFWIYGVPLAVGWNVVTLSATDAAGNQSAQEVRIERHPVEIHIDTPAREQLATRQPTITGTISDPAFVVWVNGVKAAMEGARWTAHFVPLNKETGTAITQAVAVHRSQADGLPARTLRAPRLEDMGNPKVRVSTVR